MTEKGDRRRNGVNRWLTWLINILRDSSNASNGKSVLIRFGRHLFMGGIGMILYLAVLTFLVEILRAHAVHSSMIAFAILVVYTYIVSRVWVYSPTKEHSYSAPRFVVVTAVAFILNTSIMYLAVEVMHWWYLWGQLGAAFVIPPINFLLNYLWAFK